MGAGNTAGRTGTRKREDSMSAGNVFARIAIVAALALLVLAPCTPAQQGGAGPASSPAATGQVNKGPQKDPNMPPLIRMNDAPIYWQYGSDTVPLVSFKNPPDEGLYLGFDKDGSLIRNSGNGKIYHWKLTDPNTMTGSLTLAYNSYQAIPLDVLASLQNPNSIVTDRLAMNNKAPQPATIPRQQGGAGSANSPAATGQVNKGPQKDPNMPPLTTMTESNVPIYWTYHSATLPSVHFKNPAADGTYLGFNENGSLIRSPATGKVYYWKLTDRNTMTGTLTVAFNNYKDIPLDTLAALQNPSSQTTSTLALNNKAPQPATIPQQPGGAGPANSPAAAEQINRGLQHDSNFPPLTSQTEFNVPLTWSYHSATRPTVYFKNPAADGDYLGFNDQGSMVQNQGNGKVYLWNLKENSLTLVANNVNEIPVAVLQSLKNTDEEVGYLLAKRGIAPKTQPVTVAGGGNPPPPKTSANPFGPDAGNALAGLAPAGGMPADITGKNASIQGGVLTFTLADGAKSKPYTVVRPGFMANAPEAAGVTGTWIARENGGKGIMFTVRDDNTVTGKEIPPQVVQMLMQGVGRR
jgi:hypothetical protein